MTLISSKTDYSRGNNETRLIIRIPNIISLVFTAGVITGGNYRMVLRGGRDSNFEIKSNRNSHVIVSAREGSDWMRRCGAVAAVRLIAEWFSRANGNFRRAESDALCYYYKGDDARGGMKYLGNLRRTPLLGGRERA